jgi:hypothetical protein
LGSLFGLAFVVKYLVLASLTVQGEQTWTQKILETVMKEASFGLLDLPKFAAGTGYIQFFTLIIYVVGLILLSPSVAPESSNEKKRQALELKNKKTLDIEEGKA